MTCRTGASGLHAREPCQTALLWVKSSMLQIVFTIQIDDLTFPSLTICFTIEIGCTKYETHAVCRVALRTMVIWLLRIKIRAVEETIEKMNLFCWASSTKEKRFAILIQMTFPTWLASSKKKKNFWEKSHKHAHMIKCWLSRYDSSQFRCSACAISLRLPLMSGEVACESLDEDSGLCLRVYINLTPSFLFYIQRRPSSVSIYFCLCQALPAIHTDKETQCPPFTPP